MKGEYLQIDPYFVNWWDRSTSDCKKPLRKVVIARCCTPHCFCSLSFCPILLGWVCYSMSFKHTLCFANGFTHTFTTVCLLHIRLVISVHDRWVAVEESDNPLSSTWSCWNFLFCLVEVEKQYTDVFHSKFDHVKIMWLFTPFLSPQSTHVLCVWVASPLYIRNKKSLSLSELLVCLLILALYLFIFNQFHAVNQLL